VPIPRLYHDGGLRTVLGSSFVAATELVPGGQGAAWGLGLGGVVAVETVDFASGARAEVAADGYDVAAGGGGPLGDRWSVGIAGRWSYVGELLGAFDPAVGEVFPLPRYRDAQARVGLALGPGESIDLTGLWSADATRRVGASADPTRQVSEVRSLDFHRWSVRYRRGGADGTAIDAVIFGGADDSSWVQAFGAVETSLQQSVSVAGARASYRSRPAPWLHVELGVDALVPRTETTRVGALALPSREGDIRVFGQPPPDQIAADTHQVAAVHAAPYAEARAALFTDRLLLVAGLRVDPYARSVSHALPVQPNSPSFGVLEEDLRAEPRLAARWTAGPVRASVAWGLYGQQPAAADLSAAFGNPALPIATATHLVGSVGWNPGEALDVEVTTFRTRSEELAVRNPAEQPARAEALLPLGQGRSEGVQLAVQVGAGSAFARVAYTLSASERQDGPGEAWRRSDFDQPHSLTALAGLRPRAWLEVGGRGRVASGYPRTEVVGAYVDSRRGLYQPLFGAHNAIRLPTFAQLDVRVAARARVAGGELWTSLEVQNLTNRVNGEEYVYSVDYAERGLIRGLPLLPVLGLRWSAR
jgi:hypothetical protein